MYFVAPIIISCSDFNNTFGSRPPCNTTSFRFFLAHKGSISESKFNPSGLTKSLKSLNFFLMPFGKQILGIFQI